MEEALLVLEAEVLGVEDDDVPNLEVEEAPADEKRLLREPFAAAEEEEEEPDGPELEPVRPEEDADDCVDEGFNNWSARRGEGY